MRDGTCRLSNHPDGLEAAHIVPKAQDYWFDDNELSR